MITTFQGENKDLKLSIEDCDFSKSNVRYKAVINDDQLAVLHLQTVDTELTHQDVSQLSLCPGVLESDVVSSFSITKFLIEKVDDQIVYRLREL